MARLRMIAGEERFVPLLQRVLDVDQVFEVDDNLFNQFVWPSDTFEVVTESDNDPTEEEEE